MIFFEDYAEFCDLFDEQGSILYLRAVMKLGENASVMDIANKIAQYNYSDNKKLETIYEKTN